MKADGFGRTLKIFYADERGRRTDSFGLPKGRIRTQDAKKNLKADGGRGKFLKSGRRRTPDEGGRRTKADEVRPATPVLYLHQNMFAKIKFKILN